MKPLPPLCLLSAFCAAPAGSQNRTQDGRLTSNT